MDNKDSTKSIIAKLGPGRKVDSSGLPKEEERLPELGKVQELSEQKYTASPINGADYGEALLASLQPSQSKKEIPK